MGNDEPEIGERDCLGERPGGPTMQGALNRDNKLWARHKFFLARARLTALAQTLIVNGW